MSDQPNSRLLTDTYAPPLRAQLCGKTWTLDVMRGAGRWLPETKPIFNVVTLSALLLACSSHLPQRLADLDNPTVASKRLFEVKEDVRTVFEHVRQQVHACFVERIYPEMNVPMGRQRYAASIDDSGQTAQIVLHQEGPQTYLVAKISFLTSPTGTIVETATKIPQNKHLGPLFAEWIGLKSGCKASRHDV